eukprot:ctg_2151.g562
MARTARAHTCKVAGEGCRAGIASIVAELSKSLLPITAGWLVRSLAGLLTTPSPASPPSPHGQDRSTHQCAAGRAGGAGARRDAAASVPGAGAEGDREVLRKVRHQALIQPDLFGADLSGQVHGPVHRFHGGGQPSYGATAATVVRSGGRGAPTPLAAWAAGRTSVCNVVATPGKPPRSHFRIFCPERMARPWWTVVAGVAAAVLATDYAWRWMRRESRARRRARQQVRRAAAAAGGGGSDKQGQRVAWERLSEEEKQRVLRFYGLRLAPHHDDSPRPFDVSTAAVMAGFSFASYDTPRIQRQQWEWHNDTLGVAYLHDAHVVQCWPRVVAVDLRGRQQVQIVSADGELVRQVSAKGVTDKTGTVALFYLPAASNQGAWWRHPFRRLRRAVKRAANADLMPTRTAVPSGHRGGGGAFGGRFAADADAACGRGRIAAARGHHPVHTGGVERLAAIAIASRRHRAPGCGGGFPRHRRRQLGRSGHRPEDRSSAHAVGDRRAGGAQSEKHLREKGREATHHRPGSRRGDTASASGLLGGVLLGASSTARHSGAVAASHDRAARISRPRADGVPHRALVGRRAGRSGRRRFGTTPAGATTLAGVVQFRGTARGRRALRATL